MISQDSKHGASDRGSPSFARSSPPPPLADHPFIAVHEWTATAARTTAPAASKPLFDIPVSGTARSFFAPPQQSRTASEAATVDAPPGAVNLADTIASLHHTFSPPPPYDAASHVLCDATGVAWPAATKLERLPRLVYLRPTRFVRLHVYDRLPSAAATATTRSSGPPSASSSTTSSAAAPVVVAVFAAISVHVSAERLESIVADMRRQKSSGDDDDEDDGASKLHRGECAYLRLLPRSDGVAASQTALVDRNTTLAEAWPGDSGAADREESAAPSRDASVPPPPPPPPTDSTLRCLYRVAARTTKLYFRDAGDGAPQSPTPQRAVYSGPVPLTWTALQMLRHLFRTQPQLRPGHETPAIANRRPQTEPERKLATTVADGNLRTTEEARAERVAEKKERKGTGGGDSDDGDDESFSGIGLTELVSGESSARNTGTGASGRHQGAREIVAQANAQISPVDPAPLVAAGGTQPRSLKCLCLYAADSSSRSTPPPPLLPTDLLLGADPRQSFELRYDDAMDVVIVRPAAAAAPETSAVLPPVSLVGISRRHHVRQLVSVAQRRYPELARRHTTLSAYTDGDRRAVTLPKDAPIPASVLNANPTALSSAARPIVLYASWIREFGGSDGGERPATQSLPVATPVSAPPRRSRRSAVGYPATPPATEPSLPVARAPPISELGASDRPIVVAAAAAETSLVAIGVPTELPPPSLVAAAVAPKRDARFDYAPQLGPVGEPDPQAVADYLAERASRERRAARRALRAQKRGSGSDTSSSLSSLSRTLGAASSASSGSSTSSRRRRPPAPLPDRRTGELEDARDARSNRGGGGGSGSDLDSLAGDDVTALELQARRNGNPVGGGGGGGGDRKRGAHGSDENGSDLESVAEDDLTALELQARRNGSLVGAATAGARSSDDGGGGSNESDLESVTDDLTALELQARRGIVRGGGGGGDGAESDESENDDDDDYGPESIDAIRGNVRDMFPPPDLVRWCDGCVRANKPQGCAYIRVLVTYNGISRQIPMPCQPTVEEVINRATDAFQVDAVGRTFRLYTRSQPFVALPQNTRLVQLRTTSLYEFILRPGRHTGRVCQGLAILLVALAITAAVWWFFALLSETAGANGRYGGPWRSAPLSWGGGAGRGAAAAGGIGVGDTMGVETRPRTAPPDGALPFYRGETELNSPSLFGIEY